MWEISLLDKVSAIFEITKSSPFFILVIISFIFLAFLFITTNKNNAKQSKKVYILIYLVTLLVLGIQYGSSFGKMVDYLMNNVFIFFYFPNLAVYLIAIIITNIILWKTLFLDNNKALKILNSVVYCVIHYILILILEVVNTEKLNVFSQTSVYGNKDAMALIELSSLIFVVWLIFIAIFSLIYKYQTRNAEKMPYQEFEYIKIKPEEKDSLIEKVVPPSFIRGLPKKVNNDKKIMESYDSMFTLDEYKLLLSVLKEEQEKIQIRENNTLKENLDAIKLVIEPEEKEEPVEKVIIDDDIIEKENKNHLTELQALYQSIE